MASTPQPPPESPISSAPQKPLPGFRERYEAAEGAISIARVKRVGAVLGLVVLGFFTLWEAAIARLLPIRRSRERKSGR